MKPIYPTKSLKARRLVAEGIGTFFLVLIGPGTAMVNAFAGGTIGPAGILWRSRLW